MGLLDDSHGRLAHATERFSTAWDNLSDSWRDRQRQAFEGRYFDPLKSETAAYRSELEALMAVVHRVERELRS